MFGSHNRACDIAALQALQFEEGFEVAGAKWPQGVIDATSGSNSGPRPVSIYMRTLRPVSGLRPTGEDVLGHRPKEGSHDS